MQLPMLKIYRKQRSKSLPAQICFRIWITIPSLHFYFQLKSEVIATYALCGFANFGAMGITLGVLGTLIPAKKSSLAKMALRAMICGNMACFLTACIAGEYLASFLQCFVKDLQYL